MRNSLFESYIDKLNIPSDMKSAVKEIHHICLEAEGTPLLEDFEGTFSQRAKNSIQSALHKIKNFITRDVKIGSQTWSYDTISAPENHENGIFVNPSNGKTLFTWDAAVREAKKYPGWHMPTTEEFQELIDFCGGEKAAGIKLKTTKGWDGVEGWSDPGNGIDTYGFSAKPVGPETTEHFGFDTPEDEDGFYATYWSADENGWNDANTLAIGIVDSASIWRENKKHGAYLRLIKD